MPLLKGDEECNGAILSRAGSAGKAKELGIATDLPFSQDPSQRPKTKTVAWTQGKHEPKQSGIFRFKLEAASTPMRRALVGMSSANCFFFRSSLSFTS